MNGQDLLEALSFAAEEYIADAESARPARRIHWQAVAAMAACLCLMSFALYRLQGAKIPDAPKQAAVASLQAPPAQEELTAEAAEEYAMMDAAPMMISEIAEMTVRFIRYEDDVAVCRIVDPGTGSYEVGTEIRISTDIPREYEQDSTASRAKAPVYRIIYLPDTNDAEVIQPLDVAIEDAVQPQDDAAENAND